MDDKLFYRSVDLVNSINRKIVINNLLKKKERILLSFSGGQDSICLLFILNQLYIQLELHLVLFWCHHLWQRDSFSLMQQITKYSFLFQFNGCFAIPSCFLPSELSARKWRHYCSSRLAFFYNYSKICLGHNSNDKVETIFLNFLRGTGLTGLSPLRWIQPIFETSVQKDEHISQFIFSYAEGLAKLSSETSEQIEDAASQAPKGVTSKELLRFPSDKNNPYTFATPVRPYSLSILDQLFVIVPPVNNSYPLCLYGVLTSSIQFLTLKRFLYPYLVRTALVGFHRRCKQQVSQRENWNSSAPTIEDIKAPSGNSLLPLKMLLRKPLKGVFRKRKTSSKSSMVEAGEVELLTPRVFFFRGIIFIPRRALGSPVPYGSNSEVPFLRTFLRRRIIFDLLRRFTTRSNPCEVRRGKCCTSEESNGGNARRALASGAKMSKPRKSIGPWKMELFTSKMSKPFWGITNSNSKMSNIRRSNEKNNAEWVEAPLHLRFACKKKISKKESCQRQFFLNSILFFECLHPFFSLNFFQTLSSPWILKEIFFTKPKISVKTLKNKKVAKISKTRKAKKWFISISPNFFKACSTCF